MKKFLLISLVLLAAITAHAEDTLANKYHVLYPEDIKDEFKKVWIKAIMVIYENEEWGILWLSVAIRKSEGIVASLPKGISIAFDFYASGEWSSKDGIIIKNDGGVVALAPIDPKIIVTSDGRIATKVSCILNTADVGKIIRYSTASGRVDLSMFGVISSVTFVIPSEVIDHIKQWTRNSVWK